MLFLAQSLLKAIGFEYDEFAERWVARQPLRAMAATECDENRAYILEALAEVRTTLEAQGYACGQAAVHGLRVSLGPATLRRPAA